MPFKQHGRQYDLVVLGATGYTGLLTAEHIAKTLPTDLKWAVAGRTHSKLQNVVDECRKLDPDRIEPTIEIARTDNQEELDELVRKTYILITTVGPYAKYGEPVVKACAQHGTHYLDVTGEFPWTHRMTKTYQDLAEKSGACIFPQIGIESTPADICTYSLAKSLREELGSNTADVTISLHNLSAGPSGGTVSSALGIFDHFTPKDIQTSSRPYSLSPVPHAKPLRPARSWLQKNLGPVYIKHLGLLSTSITTSTDAVVVERSWGVLQQLPGREKESYGPNFRWQELGRVNNWLHGAAMHWGLILCGIILATLPPLRSFLRGRVTQPGQGPTREAMARERIEYRGIAQPDSEENQDKRAYVRAYWNGGMYDVTAMFLGQAALTLLKDDGELSLTKGGFFTPACLGQDFIDRCNDNGFKMELKMVED